MTIDSYDAVEKMIFEFVDHQKKMELHYRVLEDLIPLLEALPTLVKADTLNVGVVQVAVHNIVALRVVFADPEKLLQLEYHTLLITWDYLKNLLVRFLIPQYL